MPLLTVRFRLFSPPKTLGTPLAGGRRERCGRERGGPRDTPAVQRGADRPCSLVSTGRAATLCQRPEPADRKRRAERLRGREAVLTHWFRGLSPACSRFLLVRLCLPAQARSALRGVLDAAERQHSPAHSWTSNCTGVYREEKNTAQAIRARSETRSSGRCAPVARAQVEVTLRAQTRRAGSPL
jgi:hypothetical protein